ncbi:MAG: hypothetical protein PWQ41_872 [Bacillota bacterium]|nr:hypothetical protein [Bacillota bacterium]MDK2856333.1 hypothetical protein [Bacillota bacterium]MDK2925098.1 hypothetical protein [Bacillota bacterium]
MAPIGRVPNRGFFIQRGEEEVHHSRQETTYAALEEYLKEAREVARGQQKAEAERQLAEALEKLAGGSFNLEEMVAYSAGKKLTVLEQELADEQRALIVEFMDRFRETEAGKILADFIRVQQRFSERTKQILDRVHKLVAELFAVDIKPAGVSLPGTGGIEAS